MAILRNTNKEHYTVVSNVATRDDSLSLKALGLLVKMLSLPDKWEFSENGLEKIFQKDGQASIRSGLKELEAAGYLFRKRERDEKGRVSGVVWLIYDEPHLENPSLVNSNLENPPQYNTKQYNTKELNNKEKKEYKEISAEDFLSEDFEAQSSEIDYNADNKIKADMFYQRVLEKKPAYMNGIDISYAFQMLYDYYPKHSGKKAASSSFLALVRKDTKNKIVELAINIDTYRRYITDNGTEDKYIKMMQGFINDTQYNEYPRYNCEIQVGDKYYQTRDQYLQGVISGEIEMQFLPRSCITF